MSSLAVAPLVGAQRPRIASVPPYVGTDGQEAVELAASAGLHLDDWQAWVLTESLGYRADDKWAATEVGLLVPRQNGKGSILEARELAGLFLLGERLITHTAHEFKTAQEAFLRIKTLIEGTDDLRRRVKTIRTSHGEEGIELLDGRRLRFLARSKGSGRGFTGDVVILDEAYALTSAMMAALLSTLSARPNPQIWYTSSAGDESALQLAKIRARGLEGAPRLAFFDWSVEAPGPNDPPLDMSDRRLWAQANPALGIRVSEEFVETEFSALDADKFARERLGVWYGDSAERVIPADVWRRVVSETVAPQGQVRFGLSVLPDQSAAALGASDGRTVEQVDHRDGTGWVVERVKAVTGRHGGVVVIDGNGPALSLASDLEDAGVTVEKLSGGYVAAACARMFNAIVDGAVRVRKHADLDAAAASVVKKPVGDRFVWDLQKSAGDVTPLYAVTLAFVGPEPAAPFAMWG